ncbi:hypothetical protein GALMADRAFT_60535 [Galerina marginata CBS 339.88]|uniref:ENTH domain-containing protein n=1 Tax=Galerina marginata (strain CBS 339.88) TaxID=685588 RepID=A0A067TL18_GALM3|nr:hypothetical protein GALMADRAFT_60535 [Galerina marginata CBS 339.88]
MSSYDKVVKLACKPKAAAPKAKYIDPIIAATWSDDGAVHDVCKALSPRIREPNAIVAFKALIVLHTMIRNGATDNVLSYLSSSDVLRLRNVSAGNWDGYVAPQNLQNYALYLDSRIHAYKDLKHDAVKVQAENNRDMRNSQSIEEDGYRGRKDRPTNPNASAPTRSKTIMGRKLRSMAVEKGLLRETKAVHNVIDALVECRFYLDDLEDELTITALRMLVKDLLILFQAGNEGVINVLEHYFEMSHVDAKEALVIYRHFCKQTEYVVEYLGVAKKLQNLLNVSIPNLKHAPVSLAGALEEYLNDPNFEQNRIEYKSSKAASERVTKPNGKQATSCKSTTANQDASAKSPTKVSFASTSSSKEAAPKTTAPGSKDASDFFSAIEEEQPTMFNPQTNSPSAAYFQQQGAANPFAQMAMATGQPFMQHTQIAVQPTGFIVPQPTAMPQQTVMPQQPNPFGNFLTAQAPQQTGHRPFSSYLQPQATSFVQQPQQTGFLQPQATGANPFRQSMLVPQTTGMALFGGANPQTQGSSNQMQNSQPFAPQASAPTFGFATPQAPSSALPFAAPKPSFFTSGPNNTPARPASTPLTSTNSTLSSTPQPVKSHQTGTRNPFGPIVSAQPPVPKPPTLFELSSMSLSNASTNHQTLTNQPQASQQPQQTGFNSFAFLNSSLSPGATDISGVASSFAFSNTSKPNTNAATNPTGSTSPLSSQNTSTTTTSGSTFSDSFFNSSLSSQPTGATNTSSSPSLQAPSTAPVKSHLTGFVGLKPFKPSSSFGASLMDSLPPIPGSGPTTPAVTGLPSPNGTNSSTGGNLFASATSQPAAQNGAPTNNFSFLNTQPTGAMGGFGGSSFGSTLGVGLRPQMTGGGAANPFRASMAGGPMAGGPSAGTSSFLPSAGGSFGVSQPFGNGMFGGQQQQQQQKAVNSLI